MELAALAAAGLTPGEIKVYYALLENGQSSVGPIVEKSSVSRSIIYTILEKLIEKGLVSSIIKEKTKYFQADDPQKLVEFAQSKEAQLKKTIEDVKTLIPALQLLSAQKGSSSVKVFEGFKGTMTVHEHTYDTLKKGEEYFYMGIAEQPEFYHSYWKKDHRRRIAAGIRCRLLFNKTVAKDILDTRNKYEGCNARYMPTGINPPAWIMGYSDVATISFPSPRPITIEITNREIAQSFKEYFEQLWKLSGGAK